jgi:sucrose-6-phosphate hydrolase SacC (GH32 family)
MPVELFWKETDLGVRPIREVKTLRKSLLADEHISVEAVNSMLAQNSGNLLNLEMTAVGDSASVLLCGGEETIEVRYDRKKKRLMVLDSQGEEIGRYRGGVDDVDIGDSPICFSCYLDHSLLEIYLNETKSVSLRNYFSQPRYFQVCGELQTLQLWEMTSAYPEE